MAISGQMNPIHSAAPLSASRNLTGQKSVSDAKPNATGQFSALPQGQKTHQEQSSAAPQAPFSMIG